MKRLVLKSRGAVRVTWALLLLAVAGSVFEPDARADFWMGNVNVGVQQKRLDKDSWDPAAKGLEGTLTIDFRNESWPVSATAGLFWGKTDGSADSFDLNTETKEVHLGCRKIWNDGIEEPELRPYVGAGVAAARVKAELRREGQPREDYTDWGVGPWAGAGVYWSPLPNLNVGIDVRWSTVSVELAGEKFDAGGLYYGGFLGGRWMAPF